MHYYKKNIGDYHKKAGRLSMLQHGAYTLLIDACYDRERFPTMDEAIDWSWSSTDDEVAAVKFVLSKFFDLEDGVYIQRRIEEELDKYRQTAETNKRIAIERETKRKERDTTRERDVNEAPPNHKPITNNHKPITTTKGKEKPKRFVPPSVEEVRDYVFEKGYSFDPESFVAYYDSNGWKVGKNRMKNWKACCVTWNNRDKSNGNAKGKHDITFDDINDTDWIKNVDPAVYSRTGGNG